MTDEIESLQTICAHLRQRNEELVAEIAKSLDEIERMRVFARKVEAIMDSICGAQKFNWSEHAYPLRAALEEAGYHGKGYEEARKGLGTLIEENARLRDEIASLKGSVCVETGGRDDLKEAIYKMEEREKNLRAALDEALTRIHEAHDDEACADAICHRISGIAEGRKP